MLQPQLKTELFIFFYQASLLLPNKIFICVHLLDFIKASEEQDMLQNILWSLTSLQAK